MGLNYCFATGYFSKLVYNSRLTTFGLNKKTQVSLYVMSSEEKQTQIGPGKNCVTESLKTDLIVYYHDKLGKLVLNISGAGCIKK